MNGTSQSQLIRNISSIYTLQDLALAQVFVKINQILFAKDTSAIVRIISLHNREETLVQNQGAYILEMTIFKLCDFGHVIKTLKIFISSAT